MKIFLIALTITFSTVIIPRLESKQVLVSPVKISQSQDVSVFEKLKPMLEVKPNDFHPEKSLTPSVSAGYEFDEAKAYTLLDLDTGKIIISKNPTKSLPMASLTKIMTAVVALDLADPQEEFIVSEKAAEQVPTKVMLKPGERYQLSELLESMLISSANDSAQVIQEGIDAKFKEDIFIKAMNQKAKFLDLKNTTFTNPQGFDAGSHKSSALDLSILSAYALKNYPLVAEIVSRQSLDLTRGGRDMRFYLQNWNGLLGVYPGVSGVKIGNTGKAGYTTIVVSERGGKNLLVTLLGAPDILKRDLWASQLLDLGFTELANLPPIALSELQLREKYSSFRYFF